MNAGHMPYEVLFTKVNFKLTYVLHHPVQAVTHWSLIFDMAF